MATLREVRRRISGIRSTQKITKAMKMVAAAKLRRAQTAVVAARPYARSLQQLLRHLLAHSDTAGLDLAVERPVSALAVVVVTGDRGLCGAFNANVLKATAQHLESTYPGWLAAGKVSVIAVGRRGYDMLVRRKYTIAEKFLGMFQHLTFSEAQRIARLLVEGYRAGRFDRVEIVYNEFKSIAQQRLVVEQFLPVASREETTPAGHQGRGDDIYEPTRERILESLLPRHLNFHIWRVLLESNAAEQGARMAAMDNATENARELIEHLQLQYNKARQASITKDLLEMVSGAEALRESR